MTEHEAVVAIWEKHMDFEDYFLKFDEYPDGYNHEFDQAILIAAQALEKIQQYREIGTVEECKKAVKEEDALKFYYCESEDDYYIGKRVGNFYYARYGETGFEWFMSRYLPWGEHVIAPNTLWKEHIYPSEPKEIPFFEWLQGFIKRYCGGSVEECREARKKAKTRKTRKSKFIEMFPDAPITGGIPCVSPCDLSTEVTDKGGMCDEYSENSGCRECRRKYWLEEVE